MRLKFSQIPLLILLLIKMASPQQADQKPFCRVVTRDEIERLNYEDLGDIIGVIAGVGVRDLGSTGQPLEAGVWGSNGRQVLILLNGRPLKDPQTGVTDLNIIPVEEIEKIEVFKGGAIPQYGTMPIGGVINIVTRNFAPPKPYSRILYQKGQSGYSDVDVMLSRKIGRSMDFLLGGTFKNSRGYEAQKIRGGMKYRMTRSWKGSYYLLYNKSDLDPLHSSYNHGKEIRYDHNLSIVEKGDSLKLTLYYTHLRREYRRPDWEYESLLRGVIFHHNFTLRKQLLLWGFNLEEARVKGKHSAFLGTVFLGDMLHLQDWLRVWLFGQFERHSRHGDLHSSGGGISLRIKPALSLSLGYQRAFRVPSFAELYGDGLSPQGEEGLKPETSHSYNMELLWENNAIRLSAGLYRRQVRDMIFNNGSIWINISEASFSGLDLEMGFKLWENLSGGIDLSYLIARDDQGHRLPDRPRQTAYGYLEWRGRFFEGQLGVSLRLNGRFIGTRLSDSKELHGVGVMDLKLMLNFLDNFDYFYTVENLFGQRYQKIAGHPMPGRLVRWGISWEFWD